MAGLEFFLGQEAVGIGVDLGELRDRRSLASLAW
jgi:hypothetical protein